MTFTEAHAALANIPANRLNNNAVQDAAYRLREELAFQQRYLTRTPGGYNPEAEAPKSVVERAGWLANWIAHRH